MYLAFCGKIADKIRDPSSGGIGTRLNVARTRFVNTIISKATIAGPGSPNPKNLIVSPAITASTIFDNGPAKATSASPFFPDFKALKLTGTGFAQPRMIPPGNMAQSKGNIIEPNGSICLIGFKVSLPIILAV